MISKSLVDEHVLELPWVLEIEVLVQLIPAILQRVPVSVVSAHRADVLMLDLQASLVVHLVRLH
jgi:hypothetical protein